jgi:Periplasmic binding protein/Cytochrome c
MRPVRTRALGATCLALIVIVLGAVRLASAQSMNEMSRGMKNTGPGGMWDELTSDLSNESIGMRIYRKGVLPGDRPLMATRAGSDIAPGQAACANCHQRSGLGAREGQEQIPAVTGAVLYAPGANGRSAYTDRSLSVAIRDGIDPDGRPLRGVMPRYAMQADEMDQLIAYLKQLAPRPSPGVSGSVVHLGTVVTDDVPPARKQAMLMVMNAYLDDLNHRGGELKWELDVWLLSGNAQNRRGQLQAYYAKQPILALVGGLSTDTWLPVHEFCQQQKVPCLFPNTSVPVSDRSAFYAVYFDKGSVLRAQILARYFADHPQQFSSGRIVQIVPADWTGYEPAGALRQAMGRSRAHRVVDQVVAPGAPLVVEYWREVLASPGAAGAVCAVILWGTAGDNGLAGLTQLAAQRALPPIFVAADPFSAGLPAFDPRLRDRLFFVSTLDPAAIGSEAGSGGPWEAWLETHHVQRTEPLLQANTFFVMKLVDEAVSANAGDFTPEHLIERIEYSTGGVVQHPMLESLSLGMGQRFAIKGGYVLAPVAEGAGGMAAVSERLIP